MKTLLLVLALSSVSVSAQSKDKLELCETISNLAESIMYNRQNGVSMVEQYKLAEGNQAVELMVNQAYSRSKKLTEEYKRLSISEFKNAWFKSCLDNLS